ncbi:MAG: structural protein P5 [Alphaproteobacteria bacterium]|nr:structural protein P5 [Alphaproteobacteria bacterium]
MTDAAVPRGIRNANPGNIRHNADRWRGASADQSADAEFVQFEHPVYGLRAMARILLNYQAIHGLLTVRRIIGRWAPPAENDTAAYARHVAQEMAVGLDFELDLATDRDALRALMRVMVRHENGQQPYPDWLFDDAIALALA